MIEGVSEYVPEGALALLVLDRVIQIVRTAKGKPNGHSKIDPSDAHQFWDLQKGMDHKLDRLLERLPKRS